ncbi:HET-domain-containing protein, partial [Tothia fuscella]
CIDKTSKAELSRSINSMFHWYRNATRCYVYLYDDSRDTIESEIRRSKWFTRGWTLQELLAPASVEFFSSDYRPLGDKTSLGQLINMITNIPRSALERIPLSQFSADERMSWMEYRETKLEEDKVCSLLGIFGVRIPPVYGEGRASAFKRLQKEIDRLDTCTKDLRLTDPRDDKNRIEETKGGLLDDSYC